ncbi:MAG: MBL fold metallo-hydrolase [Candidatus Rifleibacteriota bacterium]
MEVRSLFLGNSNVYLIACQNDIALVDGGLGDRSDKIISAAREMVREFRGIRYVLVTHAHYDHVGSVEAIREKTGARVVAHEIEAINLAEGRSPVPAGTMWLSKQISWLGCILFRHCIRFSGFKADVTFADRIELPFGDDKIICHHLPGHTSGSIGIEAGPFFFAGDTVFHLLPEWIFPPFADDVKALAGSWGKILKTGAKSVYPGHGRPIQIGLLKSKFERLKF